MFETVVTSTQAGTIARLASCELRYGGPAGPLATISREPGQAWKGAAAAVTLCAEVWLVGLPPISLCIGLSFLAGSRPR